MASSSQLKNEHLSKHLSSLFLPQISCRWETKEWLLLAFKKEISLAPNNSKMKWHPGYFSQVKCIQIYIQIAHPSAKYSNWWILKHGLSMHQPHFGVGKE